MGWFRRCLAALLALSAGLGATPVLAAEDCALHRVIGAELDRSQPRHLLIRATLDGEKMLLLVDTGASYSALFDSVVAKLALPREDLHIPIYGVDGRTLAQKTILPRLSIGGVVSEGEEFDILASSEKFSQDGVAGLFGSDYLRNYDLEIDPAAGRLNLFSQDHCSGRVVYWSKVYNRTDIHVGEGGQIRIPTELDGRPIEAMIDTGAPATMLRLSAASLMFGLRPDSPGMIPAGRVSGAAGRPLAVYRYRFKSLVFGGLTVRAPMIEVSPLRDLATPTGSHIMQSMVPDLIIGMDIFSQLHSYVAYGERRLYFTLANERSR